MDYRRAYIRNIKYLGNLLGRVQKIEDPSNNAIENNTFIDLSLAPDALSPSETADTEQAANNEFNA